MKFTVQYRSGGLGQGFAATSHAGLVKFHAWCEKRTERKVVRAGSAGSEGLEASAVGARKRWVRERSEDKWGSMRPGCRSTMLIWEAVGGTD